MQVRDLLHPTDLCELIALQAEAIADLSGETFNIGGGLAGSVSLMEFTNICQNVTGNEVTIGQKLDTKHVDIPWYITDHSKITERLGWAPRMSAQTIAHDTLRWIIADRDRLSGLLQ